MLEVPPTILDIRTRPCARMESDNISISRPRKSHRPAWKTALVYYQDQPTSHRPSLPALRI